MSSAPITYKGTSGVTVQTTYNLHGYPVNYLYFWENNIKNHPEFLDDWNKGRVYTEGKAPIFTNELKANFEKNGISTDGLKLGDVMEHHHMNQGRTAIPITSSEHDKIPTQKNPKGVTVRNKFGQIVKKGAGTVNKAMGAVDFLGQITGLFTGNPDAWINQFGNKMELGVLSKSIESNLYYTVVSIDKNESSGTAYFWVYSSHEWDEKQRKYVGVDVCGVWGILSRERWIQSNDCL